MSVHELRSRRLGCWTGVSFVSAIFSTRCDTPECGTMGAFFGWVRGEAAEGWVCNGMVGLADWCAESLSFRLVVLLDCRDSKALTFTSSVGL